MKYCDKCRASYPNEFNVCPIDNSSLRVASELFSGMTIRDKYLILDQIGRGGMGIVFRVKHLAFGEMRAIKVVDAQLAEDRSFVKRFKTEAIIARKLQHPNAVRIDDLDSTEDGRPFIVMELVEGRSLKNLIAQEGVLPVARALSVACQVADVLSAAHRLGIVHRDIKPDNILVSTVNRADDVKVADFGIAKVKENTLNVGTAYTSTVTGAVIGTPQYISPEQALGKQADQLDGRSDIYSLGVVLYEMLTGQLPFDADTPMGFLLHHLQTPPVSASLLRPDLNIPSTVSALLAKMLEKDREKRFATADELVRELQHLQGLAPSESRHPAGVPYVNSRTGTSGIPALRTNQMSAPTFGSNLGTPTRKESSHIEPVRRTNRGIIWLGVAVFVAAVIGGLVWASHLSERTRQTPPRPVPTVSTGPTDVEISAEVVRALRALKDSSIDVDVRSGVVILSGNVANQQDQNQAYVLAGRVAGVKSVRNEITVKPLLQDTTTGSVSSTVASPPSPRKQVVQRDKRLFPDKPPIQSSSAEVQRLVEAGKQATENGEYKTAIDFFQKALKTDPRNSSAQAGLRQALQAQQTEESVLKK